MTDAEIIDLFTDAEQSEAAAPLTSRAKDYTKHCQHERIELARDNRRAYCKDCGEERDLFDVLVRFAGRYEYYVESWKTAKREAETSRAQLEEVLRQERNAKSRLRAARGKQGLRACGNYGCKALIDIAASKVDDEDD
jgi:hypothetical protein